VGDCGTPRFLRCSKERWAPLVGVLGSGSVQGLGLGGSGARAGLLATRRPGEGQGVCAMDDAFEDRVGDRRIAR